MISTFKNITFSYNDESKTDFSLALLLASLPLPFAFINITFGLFVLSVILDYKRLKFQFNSSLILPILFYLLCALSLLWSINPHDTSKYLSKGLFFIALPLLFLFIPKITKERRTKIFNNYSYLMVIATIFYLFRAFFRYLKTGDTDYFFYHSLVTLDVNAIYVSLFIAFAFINLFVKKSKNWIDFICIPLLFGFLVLLSSKNVIIITLLGVFISFIFQRGLFTKRNTVIVLIGFGLLLIPLSSKIKERFDLEFQNTTENVKLENNIINVSLKNAWEQKSFGHEYYFNGTAFRLYQIRIFKEFLEDDHIFFTGYGASAEQSKIKAKQLHYELYDYYGDLNFHNQYIQSFSGVGIFGFLLTVAMVITNWIKSIKTKDFIFFFYTLLSTSIMFTESLFQRQRGIVFFILLYCIFHHTYTKKVTP